MLPYRGLSPNTHAEITINLYPREVIDWPLAICEARMIAFTVFPWANNDYQG